MNSRRKLIQQFAMVGTASAALAATGTAFAESASFSGSTATSEGSFSIRIAASDAPQNMKDIADIVCSGTNDQIEINRAISSLIPTRTSGLGGVVQLSPGTFFIADKVLMRPRVTLAGSGKSTTLKATSQWSSANVPNQMGGVIEADGLGVDKCHITSLAIDGNSKQVHGIFFHITEKSFDDGSPDAANTFSDLYVYRPAGDGIRFTGTRMRAAQVSTVRVWNAGGYGYYLENPDSFYSHLETGSSGNSGFYTGKANNRFTNCKAWFSAGHGFEIDSTRNQFSACESQDNIKHGYSIQAGQNSFSSCHADSNSWSTANPQGNYSGFFVARYSGYIQLIGCQAYDKNENNRGTWQKYGFELEGNNNYCQIVGSAKDNASSTLHNPIPGNDSSIDVVGS